MKIIAWLLLLVLLVVMSPFLYYGAIGLSRGDDVGHTLRDFFSDKPRGNTISEGKVPAIRHPVSWMGDVENHRLREASGIVQSIASHSVFFAVNDGGNEPELFAMDHEGKDLGFWKIDVEKNVDWEDIASFNYEGEAYLLIADTGDNFYGRSSVEFIIIREPGPDSLSMDAVLPVEWRIEVEYPDGYRDCEAAAVDEKSETILFLSKRIVPAEVFRIPLRPPTRLVKATLMALLHTIPQPNEQDEWESPKYGTFRSQPTALDLRGNKAVVFTYKDVYLYERGWQENWIEAFAKVPIRIPLPAVYQQEAGLITINQKYLYVTTEREGGTNRAGIYRVEL